MPRKNENFNFETSPMLGHIAIYQTDGTTNLQSMSAFLSAFAINGASALPYVEPEQLKSVGNDGHILDALSRLLIFATRGGGTGTWSANLNFRRTATGTSYAVPFDIALANTTPVIALDGPFDQDFMKALGSPSLTDELTCSVTVTPGSASVVDLAVMAFIVPGFVDGTSNKGANLSAPQFLTYR